MKRTNLISRLITFFALFLLSSVVYAGKPAWAFTPLTATSITVPNNGTATVQYQVRNQSPTKVHRLVMMPISGVSQNAPCVVRPKRQPGDSCTLTLTITGNKVPMSGISGGPELCEANKEGTPNPNQCYQPSKTDGLNIAIGTEQFTVSLAANPGTIDLGGATILTATASNGTPPYAYAYSNLPTGCTSVNTASLSCTPSTSGTYANITVTVTDRIGDTVTSSPTTVTVNSALSLNLAANPSTINAGQTSTLTATVSGGSGTYSTYAFYSGATCTGTALQTGASNTYMASPSSTTTYCVEVTDFLSGMATNTTTVTVETVAYVTPLSPDASNSSQVQQYLLSQDGLLSFFDNATQVEEHYGQMTFATVNGTQYAYILENGVIYCSINSNGTFNNCTPTTAPTHGMNHPHGIAFATFNQQYAYLSDPSSSSLFQCTIDTTSADLSSCLEYADANIDAALGIAFNTDGNGAQHAYIADAATGMIVCAMDANGSFMNPPGCAITPSLGAPNWVPYSIAFTTAGGTRYAYVADNGISTNLGHVYRCLLNADGTFKDNGCVATPTDTSSFAPWNPYYIAFKTLNGIQYAYVVNNQSVNIGSIYRCTVDKTTGLLTQDCIKTPDIPTSRDTWQPSGIAFR